MKKIVGGFVAAGAAVMALAFGLAPSPAKADSFSFGYSSGWHSGPSYHRHRHHRHHYHGGYYRGSYWGPPVYYRPRVVVVEPPPRYYTPPPPVYYAPSPYGGQLSATPASPVYQAQNGQYCREYQANVIVNGQPQPSWGTACLMPDGAWRVVN